MTQEIFLTKMRWSSEDSHNFESMHQVFSFPGLSFEEKAAQWATAWNTFVGAGSGALAPTYLLNGLVGTSQNLKAGAQNPQQNEINLPELKIGQNLRLTYTGKCSCTICGREVKKLFDGNCYPCLSTKAQADRCVMNPVNCHYTKGTCREPNWGLEFCYQPHLVYLAFTDKFKVGITRLGQAPTRWIDQGATLAVPIALVSSRHQAGLIEHELKNLVSDKSHWLKMLQNGNAIPEKSEQESTRKGVLEHLQTFFSGANPAPESLLAQNSRDFQTSSQLVHLLPLAPWLQIQFPGHEPNIIDGQDNTPAKKLSSINFEKLTEISMQIDKIKGQYLIFGNNCFNVRRHEGYLVKWDII